MFNGMEITDRIVADFRKLMPAFSDSRKWGTDIIRQYLSDADWETGGSGWGSFDLTKSNNFKKRGMYNYTAHMLVYYYGDKGASDPTAISPDARQNISSQSVGDESVTYRDSTMENSTESFWSVTSYGDVYKRLRNIAMSGSNTTAIWGMYGHC